MKNKSIYIKKWQKPIVKSIKIDTEINAILLSPPSDPEFIHPPVQDEDNKNPYN